MPESTDRNHNFHAEATILEGNIELPISQKIEPQVNVKLPKEGGYLSERGKDYRLEEIMSFRSAFTHTAGHLSKKAGEGWNTLTTTVVEGLNVFEVLTADRVVGQMITVHPLEGYVPKISFLGTRFENLRIAGHPVELELDPDVVGLKPENDAAYTSDERFLGRATSQYDRIRKSKDLPSELAERYNRLSSTLGSEGAVECSLVNQAAGGYPGRTFGHVIKVPGFGTITLAKLTIKHEDPHEKTKIPTKTTFTLTMVELNLGCPIHAMMSVAKGSSNGGSYP